MNKAQTQIQAKAVRIVELLSQGDFCVPWHQRRYDWDKEHITELLEDLKEAVESNSSSYFLGPMMLVEKDHSEFEVNDGQQRLITMSLICAKLLRIFDHNSEQGHVDRCSRVLFVRDEWSPSRLEDADNYEPRFTPSQTDLRKFNTLIRGNDVGANGKLTTAWDEIDKFFSLMSCEDAKNFFDFMASSLEVACLYVPQSLDANSVFETLNARGKPLSNLDKIRNHIYSFFSHPDESVRRRTVNRNLENIIAPLRTPKSESRIEEYVRAFFQNEYGFLPSVSLYRGVKSNIRQQAIGNNRQEAAKYVHDIVAEMCRGDFVQTFLTIRNPNLNLEIFDYFKRDSRQNSRSKRLRVQKRNLNEFLNELRHYTVTHTLIFAIMRHYVSADRGKKRDVARWAWEQLDILTSFIMRTSYATTKLEPSRFDREFAELSQRITAQDDPTAISVVETLRRCDDLGVFSDDTFKEALGQSSIRVASKARRFLLAIAHHEQNELSIVNDGAYTLEHVLPKSDTYLEGWGGFDKESHAEFVVRLGNMAILAEGDNQSSRRFNRNFEAKKPMFSDSVIHLTNKIAEIQDWTPERIQYRQHYLAERAVEVWALSDE